MIIKAESYKIFSEIYCPIMPAPLELFFGDGCRSESILMVTICNLNVLKHVVSFISLYYPFIIYFKLAISFSKIGPNYRNRLRELIV